MSHLYDYFYSFWKEKSWNLAESVCQSNGGDLVSLLDESEKNFVYQKVINRRDYDYYWIGLNDLERGGVYKWVSTQGEPEQDLG